MALDPNILLQARSPNLIQALTQGISAGQAIRQAPLLEALQKQKLAQAQAQMQQEQALAPLRQQLMEAQIGAQQQQPNIDLQKQKFDQEKEFRKEERKAASGTVSALNKRAGEIQGSFNKVKSLESQMRGGNRQAIAAAIMNTARLISPGVVTDADFQNLSGAQNPLALAFDIIGGRNPNVAQQLNRYIDPTNPETFDVDALLNVAGSVASSEAPVILNQFNDAKARAERAGISEKAFKTFFEGQSSIGQLGELTGFSSSQPQNNLPKGTKKNQDGTFTLPDGTVVRRKQ